MHTQLGDTGVDGANASHAREHGTDGAAATGIVAGLEDLEITGGFLGDADEKSSGEAVCGRPGGGDVSLRFLVGVYGDEGRGGWRFAGNWLDRRGDMRRGYVYGSKGGRKDGCGVLRVQGKEIVER